MRNTKMLGAAAALAAVMAMPAVVAADGHEGEVAKVRVGHFSPDAPAVDVYAGDAILGGLEGVPFGVISDYLDVPEGTYAIAVVAAGADLADGAVIGPVELTFEAGSRTTVAATNALETIEAQVLPDPEPMPQEGIAQVRVVHFSADAPAVDVAVDEGDVVVPELAYPNAAGYLDLPEGEYDLEIRAAGTTDVAFDIPPLPLAGNTSYTVFAIGSLADETFTVLPVVDADAAAGEMMDDEMAEEEMTEEAE